MNSYGRSVIPMLACVAFLAAPVSFGAASGRAQAQAQVLDRAEFLCSNCFFGASDYYYCIAADDAILIGYQRTPVLNWRDKSKNYLTRVHPGWTAWTPPSQSFAISYDDKHIWVGRTEGKQVRLIRSSLRDIFTNDDRCRGKAVKAQ